MQVITISEKETMNLKSIKLGGIWKGLEVGEVPVGSSFIANLFQVLFFTFIRTTVCTCERKRV